jgi:hypothetical protein
MCIRVHSYVPYACMLRVESIRVASYSTCVLTWTPPNEFHDRQPSGGVRARLFQPGAKCAPAFGLSALVAGQWKRKSSNTAAVRVMCARTAGPSNGQGCRGET